MITPTFAGAVQSKGSCQLDLYRAPVSSICTASFSFHAALKTSCAAHSEKYDLHSFICLYKSVRVSLGRGGGDESSEGQPGEGRGEMNSVRVNLGRVGDEFSEGLVWGMM